MPEDEQEDVEDGQEDDNEPEEELKPSLQAIKELEDLTLKEPKNINAWLQLERRLTKSYLPKKYELGLACLAEGLNFNPTNGKLWRRYWILFNQTYPEADRNDDFRKKKTEIKEFCEENVDLGCNDFWTKYINMEKTFSSKAEVLEKYIARLLQHQISVKKARHSLTDREEKDDYELQFASAILYRAYLFTLEGLITDAQDFILEFIKLCPQLYSTDSPEDQEYRQNHDRESEIEFDQVVVPSLMLVTSHLIIRNELPEYLQQPRFKIFSRKQFQDMKSELVTFDQYQFIFMPEKFKGDLKLKLNEESNSRMTELQKLFRGIVELEEGWNSDCKSLVLQLFELFHRSDCGSTQKWLGAGSSDCLFWTFEFDLLRNHLELAAENKMVSDYTNHEFFYSQPQIGFPLAYHMFGLDSEEGLANALTYLEATIGN